MATEDNYKYLAKDSTCDKTAVAKGTYKITSWERIPSNNVADFSQIVTI